MQNTTTRHRVRLSLLSGCFMFIGMAWGQSQTPRFDAEFTHHRLGYIQAGITSQVGCAAACESLEAIPLSTTFLTAQPLIRRANPDLPIWSVNEEGLWNLSGSDKEHRSNTVTSLPTDAEGICYCGSALFLSRDQDH